MRSIGRAVRMAIPDGFRERTPHDDTLDRLREIDRKLDLAAETAISAFAIVVGLTVFVVLRLIPDFVGNWLQTLGAGGLAIIVGGGARRYLMTKYRTGYGSFGQNR